MDLEVGWVKYCVHFAKFAKVFHHHCFVLYSSDHQLNIDYGFNFEVFVYLEGLVIAIKIAAED